MGPPLPMREPTYFVLAALLAGPLHGYASIMTAAEHRRTRGRGGLLAGRSARPEPGTA